MSSFHYDFILSKRSSLAKVWLAAHWEKKLSKVQVFETNLPTIVQDIIHPKVPIALHTSSHLLVGLVRIYSRKAKYLLKDCSETLVNIKVAFRPGSYEIDNVVKKQKSSTGSEYVECSLFITKKLDLLDHWIPDVSAEIDSTLNQSKHEEITLREESMKLNSLKDYFDDDEGFGEMDNEGSVNAFDQATSYCVSTLERGQSLADSAYGTEDIGSLETFSSSDYYSDPFSSGLTPVKNPSSPIKIARDHLNILPLNVDNLDNDMELCSSPIAITDFTLTDEETKTVEPELAVDKFVQARENELEKNSATFELDEAQRLKRSFGEREDGTDVILESIESINKNVRSPRKKLKRTIFIDVETSLNREVIVDNIAHPERHLSEPKFATPRKKLMKEERNTASLLAKSFNREMTPTLNKLFCSNFHLKQSRDSLQTFTDESTLPEDCTDFNNLSNVNETIAQEEGVALTQEFIPLHDEEYSSDEECSWSRTYEKNEELDVSSFNNALTMDDDAIFDENILKDRFCSFVETKIQNAPSNEVTFQQIVGSNVVKLSRKIVAQRFLKCLIMQRDSRLTLNQEESFGVITLKPPSEHS